MPATAPEDDGTLAESYVDYAVNHVIVTGQSNSVANGGRISRRRSRSAT